MVNVPNPNLLGSKGGQLSQVPMSTSSQSNLLPTMNTQNTGVPQQPTSQIGPNTSLPNGQHMPKNSMTTGLQINLNLEAYVDWIAWGGVATRHNHIRVSLEGCWNDTVLLTCRPWWDWESVRQKTLLSYTHKLRVLLGLYEDKYSAKTFIASKERHSNYKWLCHCPSSSSTCLSLGKLCLLCHLISICFNCKNEI